MFNLRWIAVFGLALAGVVLSFDSAFAFRAYVSNEKGNWVSVIDTDKMATIATVKTGQRPRGIEVSRDGKSVYAAVGEVSVGIEPEGMTVSPDSKTLVCTSETTSMVHFIDTTTREIVGNLLVGSRPRFSAYKSDGSELWVTSEIGGALAIIDPATRKLKQTVNFEISGLRSEQIQPVGINITKDGKLGFVDLGPANRVAVVDGVTHTVLKYLLVGQRVWHGAFTPDEKYLLVANGVSTDVSVIDVAAQKVIKSIPVS